MTATGLRMQATRLRRIRAAALTSIAALRQQNADLDADIALALQHAVTDSLEVEIERLEKEAVNLRRLFRVPGNPC